MNGYIDFEAKDLHDGVRRNKPWVSLTGHRTEVGQSVLESAFKMQSGGFKQVGGSFCRRGAHRRHIEFGTE